jgi:lipopolysaccharide biosynthesis glycosyltransferase
MPNAVAVVADKAFFPPAVFLVENLARLNPPADVATILLSDSIEDLRVAQAWGAHSELRVLESSRVLPPAGRLSGAAFYRLFLPEALSSFDRIIYLDTDVYVESDLLWRLFDLDMAGHAIAAVRDFQDIYSPGTKRDAELIGSLKCLNSGMMLIDTQLYLRQSLRERFIQTSQSRSAMDQHAINMTLRGDWLELSPAFNMTPRGYAAGFPSVFPPVVTHFAGPTKPWHGPAFSMDHPARREMERFFPGTPWRGFLAAHYDFNKAWKSTRPAALPALPAAFTQALRSYIAETRFADVEQGLTAPRSGYLPVGA